MNNELLIDINQYPGAVMYAKLHNLSFKQLVENLLNKFQVSSAAKEEVSLQLPPHLEKLGGCLAGVNDPNDEKLNYLLEKYK